MQETLSSRGVGTGDRPILGSFSPAQNQAILIVGVTCAAISLTTTLLTLRWFLLMKRLFRHRLVLLLILSDTFKALWYFVFPIVVFASGSVQSSSSWCQASGFLLALAIEASDIAIFLIALHAVLYVFRPPIRFGEGGLYPYRRWLPLLWLTFPILAACLAFVNRGNAYVTAGTFCYLPQRPYWYRLALAWIPRYLILFIIVGMYAAVSIYVRIKFRSFKNLADSDPASGNNSARRPSLEDYGSPPGAISPKNTSSRAGVLSDLHLSTLSPTAPTTLSPHSNQQQAPWDSLGFITSSALENHNACHGVEASDFAQRFDAPRDAVTANAGMHQAPDRRAVAFVGPRHDSEDASHTMVATIDTADQSQRSSSFGDYDDQIIADPLKRTRMAIRQQLRFLFIYPAVYVVMWAFPFANHCLLYDDALASQPIFWLQILSTAALSLQAAVNCLVFSIREKPWRRIDENSKFSLLFWRHRSATVLKRISHTGTASLDSRNSSMVTQRRETTSTDATAVNRPSRGPDWWEAEGRKRKDSVWLGTDLMSYITSRDSQGSRSPDSEEEGPTRSSSRSRVEK